MNPDLLYGAGMNELYFSTGQAAEELGITHDDVRRLYQARLIDGEITPGGQLRFPQAEVERLKASGIPNVPRPLPGDKSRPPADQPRSTGDLPDYVSDKTVAAFDEAYRLRAQVKTALLQRKLDESRDWQRRRERKETEMKESEAAAERARKAQEEAARKRASSLREWESYALSRLRYDADPDLRLAVSEAVRTQLGKLDPIPSEDATRRIVNALLEAASRMQDGRKESKAIIKETFEALPWDVRRGSKYQDLGARAIQAITAAVDAVALEATQELKTAAAQQAAQGIRKEYDHRRFCEEVLRSLPGLLPDANSGDLELAKRALSAALEQVAVGSQQMVEVVRDQVVIKVREIINQRHEAEGQARKRAAAESRLDPLMSHVDKFIGDLVRRGELEFYDLNDRRETTDALKKQIRPLLVKELIGEPGMSDERLRRRIEKLADKPLDALMAS
jgi:hypothetical protein